MENRSEDYKNIPGWGIDADPNNNPTYPIKNRTNEEHKGYTWERPPQQPVDVEILHSNERPNVSAVFGTSSPPSGLSGMIRRFAFKHSENSYLHWLPLIMADRVNMVEGIIEDIAHGHIPNIYAERGWSAEMKYNKKEFLTKAVATAVIISAVTAVLVYQSKHKKTA
ncbi:MAG: hypothetical protein K0S09_1622 [Sphingobacteriaceae bacterium]|jgi:hypothetical protein|nr:hypothetical protein [Sphingobacteriaceae bacterium]